MEVFGSIGFSDFLEIFGIFYFLKKNYGNKKIKIKKRGERKNILWSQRYFFRESFLTYLKLDIYKCPKWKVTKNFPENFETTKFSIFQWFERILHWGDHKFCII